MKLQDLRTRTTTDEIDVLVHGTFATTARTPPPWITAATPSPWHLPEWGYLPRHPDSTVLEDGDILNLDVTAYLDGMVTPTKTLLIGNVDEESRLLVERTEESLNRAIKAVKPGRQINVIGRVIEVCGTFRRGSRLHRSRCGSREFHSSLIIPHYDAAPPTTLRFVRA